MRQHVLYLLGHPSDPLIICAQTLYHEAESNRARSDTWGEENDRRAKRSAQSLHADKQVLDYVIFSLADVCGATCLFLLMCSALSALVIFVETKPSSAASSWNKRHLFSYLLFVGLYVCFYDDWISSVGIMGWTLPLGLCWQTPAWTHHLVWTLVGASWNKKVIKVHVRRDFNKNDILKVSICTREHCKVIYKRNLVFS